MDQRTTLLSTHTMRQSKPHFGYNDSSVLIPHTSTSHSDDGDEIDAGLILDRNDASSTALELQTPQDQLANYDMELDDARHEMEELRSELSASNREEKDLRTKYVPRSISLCLCL